MPAPGSDKVELQRRYRTVQEWILQDFFTSDIVTQCTNKWGVSERQAMRYVAIARTMFEDITKLKAAKRIAYHIARRQKMLRSMSDADRKTPAGIATELAIMKDIANLERLYKVELEISTPEDRPLQMKVQSAIDYSKLPTNVLQAIVNARKQS